MENSEILEIVAFCQKVAYHESGVVHATLVDYRGGFQAVVPLSVDRAQQLLPGRQYRLSVNLVPVSADVPERGLFRCGPMAEEER